MLVFGCWGSLSLQVCPVTYAVQWKGRCAIIVLRRCAAGRLRFPAHDSETIAQILAQLLAQRLDVLLTICIVEQNFVRNGGALVVVV